MPKRKNVLELCIEDTNSRQFTLRKHYPFFEMYKLNKDSPKFQQFDKSSLALAVMQFLLVEGKLKEKGIKFEDIEKFLGEYIEKTTEEALDYTELRELTKYITVKLNNGTGEAFQYSYFDPKRKSMVTEAVKYIKYVPSRNNSEEYLYYLTTDGIEFFLQTKEFGEESKVTIYLLLLQQQLKNSDFEGVYNSVVKINTEVLQQIDRKREISESLMYAGEEGFRKYKAYCEEVGFRLSEEYDLFDATYKIVKKIKDEYIKKANIVFADMKEEEQDNIQYLYSTDKELGLTIERHSNLLDEIVLLKRDVIDIRREKRRKAFKKSFSFESFFNASVKENNSLALKGILNPLFKPNIRKLFNPFKVEAMFSFNHLRSVDDAINEVAVEATDEEIITIEKMTEDRILNNYTVYMRKLLTLVKESSTVTLSEFCNLLSQKYGMQALLNADFSAFIFDLNETREVVGGKPFFNYRLIDSKGSEAKKCEKIYNKIISGDSSLSFLTFTSLNIECISGSYCELGNSLTITNFRYTR